MSNSITTWTNRIAATGAAMTILAIPAAFGIHDALNDDGKIGPNRNRAPWLKKPTTSHVEAAEESNRLANAAGR